MPGPCSAQEGVWIFDAPSDVPVVGCRALIAPVFIRSMAAGTRRGLEYRLLGEGCQATGVGGTRRSWCFWGLANSSCFSLSTQGSAPQFLQNHVP